jgi:hypothetical protein
MSKYSKLERKVKKDAKRLHPVILANSEDKLQAYLDENFPPKPARFKLTKKVAFTTAFVVVVLATLVTSLVLWWQNNNRNDGNGISYSQSDENMVASALAALNAELQYTQIALDDKKQSVYLTFDLPSKDHLYYFIAFDDEDNFTSASVYATVNTNFSERFETPIEPKIAEVNGLTVSYSETVEFIQDDGIYLVKVCAVIITDKEHIYINYEAYSLDESNNFLGWIEQAITIK